MNDDERRIELLKLFKENRLLAHKHLFAHRHKDQDSECHEDMLRLLYDPHPQVAEMAFRGAAKSTDLEEYALLGALFREAKYTIIVGPKWESACERLSPIRNELETNDALIDLFGDQKSTPWSMDELVLANGCKIQAIGAGQSMRGKKYNDERPDCALIDDLEDEENIRTEESRDRTERWLTGTLLPALVPTRSRVRFVGTPLHPKALIVKKCQDPEWKSRVFPLVMTDLETGEEKSAWPSRFPMEWVLKKRQEYINAGRFIEWEQEYMCRAEDIAGKPFQPRMIKVETVSAAYMPTEMFVDPARTTKEKSARTGYAAWSWMGNRLIVRKAKGHFHRPDEIINEIVDWNREFNPVHVGVEAVGLEEFLMQPLRTKCVQLGISIPWIDIRAPKDKISFIKGLQPFYIAGDVIHVEHYPDLEAELIQFPTGRMDVLNALAYALRMRAGRPVYDDFALRHIASVLEVAQGSPRYLCVSSRPNMTAGVLLQYVDDTLKIYNDWVFNEPPAECLGRLVREAVLAGGGQVKLHAPMEQFDRYTNAGLPAAIRAMHLVVQQTGSTSVSEGKLRPWLQKQVHGQPGILLHQDARWTINGLAYGYARRLDKGGKMADFPTDDQYRLVAEALECFVGWFDRQNLADDGMGGLRYKYTDDGKKYISILP